MKSAPGVKGPGIENENIEVELPACVKLATPKDEEEIKAFIASIVQACNRNAVSMLTQLVAEFSKKLGG